MSLSQGSRCLSCQHGHALGVLLPHLAGVVVEQAEITGTLLRIRACTRAGAAVCPACGSRSGRVHSRYERRLADAAIGGRRVMIWLRARRLFCDEPGCKKRTFAEHVLAVQASKRVANGIEDGQVPAETARWELSHREGQALMQTADAAEGPRAFAQKRTPNWEAR